MSNNGRSKEYNVAILDDDQVVRESLALYLEEVGYRVFPYAAGQRFLNDIETLSIDVMICDFCMPGMDGLQLLEQLQPRRRGIPVILITGYGNFDMARKAVELGVKALFSKPFDLKGIKKSIRHLIAENLVKKKKDDLALDIGGKLSQFRQDLDRGNERYQQLVYSSVEALLNSLEIKDEYTKMHSRRVSEYVGIFARELGLDSRSLNDYKLAGIFHDIGKIGISETILNKPSALTKPEYEVIKTHPLISEYILKPLDIFQPVIDIIRTHHEWYDGSGYPMGLKGSEVSLGGRIMVLIDAYDAMSTARPYREALPLYRILEEVERQKGRQFDPDLADQFLKFLKKGPILFDVQ